MPPPRHRRRRARGARGRGRSRPGCRCPSPARGRPRPRPRRRVAIRVASSRLPWRSRRSVQSSRGSRPAHPIATSHCPSRQARPKLSETITAGARPVSSAISARIRRAEASASSGSSETESLRGDVGAVDPGVGADPSLRRLGDQDAPLGPDHLGALLEDQLDQRRLLAQRRRQAPRLAAGDDAGEPADPALRLGDDLLRDDDDVAFLDLGPAWRSRRRSGRPRRSRRIPATASTEISPGRAQIPSTRAVRFAPAALGSELGREGDDVGRRVEVEGERGELLDRERDPRLPGGDDVAFAAALAEGGADRVRGARARGRWCRCRVGRGRRRRSARAPPSAGCRARAGRASGNRRAGGRRRPAPSSRARAIPSRAASEWPSSVGSGITSAPAASASVIAAGSPLTTIVRSTVLAAAIASSTSSSIAAISGPTPLLLDAGAQTPLGGARTASPGGSRSRSSSRPAPGRSRAPRVRARPGPRVRPSGSVAPLSGISSGGGSGSPSSTTIPSISPS